MEKQEMVTWKRIRFVFLYRNFHQFLKLYSCLSNLLFSFSFFPCFPLVDQYFLQFIYQKRSVDGSKQGTAPKKLKKDKVVGSTAKANRSESVAASGAPRVKPELALPVMYILEWPCGVALYFYNLLSVLMVDGYAVILESHIIFWLYLIVMAGYSFTAKCKSEIPWCFYIELCLWR